MSSVHHALRMTDAAHGAGLFDGPYGLLVKILVGEPHRGTLTCSAAQS